MFVCQPVGDHSGDAASGVKEQLGKLSEKAKSIGRKTKRTIVTLAQVSGIKDRRQAQPCCISAGVSAHFSDDHAWHPCFFAVRVDQTPVPEAADHSSRLHTRASSSAPPRDGDSVLEDLKDDARRIKQKVSNKMKKVGLSAESAGVEMKDKGEDMWVKTKKAARRAKDNLKETVEEAASTASTATTVQPERELFDVEDLESESEPVRAAAQSEELSTTAGRDRAGTFTVWEPKDDLNESPPGSAGSIGLKQESVKKSMLDGPQEMPQGVGKRAHDEAGRPLETGTERS